MFRWRDMVAPNLCLLALVLTSGPVLAVRSERPSLRAAEVGGTAFVLAPQGTMATLRADGPALEPGSLVEVGSGAAVFEASFAARVLAPSGSSFRVAEAASGGRRGLNIAVQEGREPVVLEVAGARIPLWAGQRASFFESGRVELGGAAAAPDILLRAPPAGFAAPDSTLRDALAASPPPARRMLETFPVAKPAAPVEPILGEHWLFGEEALLLWGALSGLALLSVIELWR